MQQDKFPVLKALTGYKVAAGETEAAAATWAQSKLSEGTAAVQKVFEQTHKSSKSLLQEAFAALKALANA